MLSSSSPFHTTGRGLGLKNERAINGSEWLMSDIQRRIDRIHWYHEFDFGNGLRAEVKTPDAKSHRALWHFIESELNKIDFTKKDRLRYRLLGRLLVILRRATGCDACPRHGRQ